LPQNVGGLIMPRILVVDDDENIPGLSGLELLGHIRQKYVNTQSSSPALVTRRTHRA
jgi:hypothetical protein